MKIKREVDVILIIVFILLFFSFGTYFGLKQQEEKLVDIDINYILKDIPKQLIKREKLSPNVKIIEIKGTKYYPDDITVSVDTNVYWINKDLNRNYRIYEKSDNQRFNSKQLQPDESFNYTFDEIGVYYYGDGVFNYMTGVVRVE